jgi:hypothetical protein
VLRELKLRRHVPRTAAVSGRDVVSTAAVHFFIGRAAPSVDLDFAVSWMGAAAHGVRPLLLAGKLKLVAISTAARYNRSADSGNCPPTRRLEFVAIEATVQPCPSTRTPKTTSSPSAFKTSG